MDKQTLVQSLGELRFLHDLDNDHLMQIADATRMEDVPPGRVLFRQGDVPRDVYLVVSGSVALDLQVEGKSQRIMTVGSGEILGWSALLEQTQMTATATATCPTTVARIDTQRLLAICQHNPRFGYELLRRTSLALASRLSAARAMLLDTNGVPLPPGG
jgi:CRP-like cAMP-binding protein